MARFDFNKTFSQTGDSIKQLSIYNPLKIHPARNQVEGNICTYTGLLFLGTDLAGIQRGGQKNARAILSIANREHSTIDRRFLLCPFLHD